MNDREKWRERVRDIRTSGRHDTDDEPVDRTLLGATIPGQSNGAMAMKVYSAFPRAPALLETHCLVSYPGNSLVR